MSYFLRLNSNKFLLAPKADQALQKGLVMVYMSIKVIGCKLTEIKTTYPTIMVSNIQMVHIKDRRPTNIPVSTLWNHVPNLLQIFYNNLKGDYLKEKQTTISSSTTTHHKPTLLMLDQSHIINQPKIISHPSPCKINLRLKLFTLYLVRLKRGCAKLEQQVMERLCNGVKGETM